MKKLLIICTLFFSTIFQTTHALNNKDLYRAFFAGSAAALARLTYVYFSDPVCGLHENCTFSGCRKNLWVTRDINLYFAAYCAALLCACGLITHGIDSLNQWNRKPHKRDNSSLE